MESKKKTEGAKEKKKPAGSFNWKKLWIQLGIMAGSFILLIIIINIVLKSYTDHGKSLTVPDLKGKTVPEIEEICKDKKVRYLIKDSSYSQNAPANTVIDQNPKAGQHVKENRRIYITINSKSAPVIKLNNVIDKSMRQAKAELINNGFEVDEKNEYKPCDDLGLVMDVKYKGQPVKAGAMLKKGSKLTLVVCDGGNSANTVVPNLIGKQFDEVMMILREGSNPIGTINADSGKVVSKAPSTNYIYKQEPRQGSKTAPGEPINIWVESRWKWKKQHPDE